MAKQNPFGSKLVYNPVPERINLEITGREQSGKSTFVGQWVKPGIAAVIDTDGRFKNSVPANSQTEFFPISDKKEEMLDKDRIVAIMEKARPQIEDETSAIIVDTVTKLWEPLIAKIQKSGKTSVYAYKEKAELMKDLRAAFNLWKAEVIWVYHRKLYYKDAGYDAKGNKVYELAERDTISDVEYSRLGADVDLSLEVVIDEGTGKRGVRVLRARKGGRTDFVYWDESGNWENVRQNLEQAVWGGLTEEQQTKSSLRDENFTTPQDAKRWAWEMSQNHGNFFRDAVHASNTYDQLKKDLDAEYKERGEKLTARIMFESWKQEVFRREQEKLAES